MADYSNVSFKNNGKLKLLIIVGAAGNHPAGRRHQQDAQIFDVILAHTGQNYDYEFERCVLP